MTCKGDFEWYDPGTVTTKDGKLVITLSEVANHNLNFASGAFMLKLEAIVSLCLRTTNDGLGMLTSWNKFCFTTGYVEVSVSLPGAGNAPGLWPGTHNHIETIDRSN